MVRLTAALISAIHDGADITAITSLTVPRRDLDQLVGLEVCERLTRLDLSDNRLPTLEGISLCTQLQWLSVAGNQLTSLRGVETLTKLTVLNASRNELTSFKEVMVLTELRALILNDNKIASVCRLDRLVNLNTIVLSRNPIRNIGNFASKLLSLKKVSLSHCQVQILGTSLKSNVALVELRLAHNQLSTLPQELERNGRLTILDIGNNHLRTWSDVQVLGSLHHLVNLNLRGNPLCSEDKYEDQVIERLPYLQILDGHAFQPNRKSKGKRSKNNDADLVKRKRDTKSSSPQHVDVEPKQNSTKSFKPRNGAEDDTRDLPFLDLISIPETDPTSETATGGTKDIKVKVSGKSKKRKDDSGVISVLDIARSTPLGGKSRKVQLLTRGEEIGIGGSSTWDDPGLTVPNVQTQSTTEMQRTDPTEHKPYSRRALKKNQ